MEEKLVKIIEINILHISVCIIIIIIMNAARILTMFKHIKAPLGRWNIHNHRETTLKIKYATEDNCGISGNNYKNTTEIQEKNKFDDDLYIYSMGYESAHN
jgi:hypothetical protein